MNPHVTILAAGEPASSVLNPQLISTVLAITAFAIALYQYRKAQKWKRAEFVASEVKDAFSDPSVRTALYLLDWNDKYYDLREKPDGASELANVRINDEDLKNALRLHSDAEGEDERKSTTNFTRTEERIRVVFDEFLGRLQRFAHFTEAGLVRKKDVLPYWRYWLDLMTNSSSVRKDQEVINAIWRYIDYYGYRDVRQLINQLGYDTKHLGQVNIPKQLPQQEEKAYQSDRGVCTEEMKKAKTNLTP